MTENKPMSLKVGNLAVFVIVFIIGILFIFDTVLYIQPGHVGVFINKLSGKVDTEAVHSGYKFKFPFFQQIVEYPYYMQTIILTQSKDLLGARNGEEINVNSIEGQPVSCDVSLSFNLEPQKVPFLYTSFRQDIENISHGYIKQSIRQAMQEVIGKMTITDFLGKGKADTVDKVHNGYFSGDKKGKGNKAMRIACYADDAKEPKGIDTGPCHPLRCHHSGSGILEYAFSWGTAPQTACETPDVECLLLDLPGLLLGRET
ncbi:MAG: hypothetical protein EOP48_24985 [Sphingobacteriales bacterium]|nr:MAG: hypothetical protein EOP48_24985 [Sphingobacteriales bacterium]